jgi:hypothetical protein
MKLKYKKMIIAVTMSAMGIGFVTFSIGASNQNSSNKSVSTSSLSTSNTEESESDEISVKSSKDASTETNTDTIAVNSELSENAYPAVNELVEQYMKATLKADLDTLDKVMTDTSSINVEDLQKQSEYIEDYKNISCYTKPGPVEGSYIVYVYSELKILDIDTLAPGLTRLYICTAEDGNLYIFSSEYDNETKEYIEATEKDEKVIALINTVNQKLATAVSSDADLKSFVDKLNKTTEEAKKIIEGAESDGTTDSSSDSSTTSGNTNND